MDNSKHKLENWVAIAGKWKFEGKKVLYLGPDDPASTVPYGIALSQARLKRGSIKTTVHFLTKPQDSVGRIMFGYNAATGEYFSIGLGGYDRSYVLTEFSPRIGWKSLAMLGNKDNFLANSMFEIETKIFGQRVILDVNGTKVLEYTLSSPMNGDQVGLFAWGNENVEFSGVELSASMPKAFVVMQFGDPFDSIFKDVIKNIADEMGLEAYRVDDVYKPGMILQDIISGIEESEVVIAEITPPNPNVFYELGYAHAMNKATILLAERGKELPFDIRSYRCIFYDNTISGKKDVESNLRKHLSNILRDT